MRDTICLKCKHAMILKLKQYEEDNYTTILCEMSKQYQDFGDVLKCNRFEEVQ